MSTLNEPFSQIFFLMTKNLIFVSSVNRHYAALYIRITEKIYIYISFEYMFNLTFFVRFLQRIYQMIGRKKFRVMLKAKERIDEVLI